MSRVICFMTLVMAGISFQIAPFTPNLSLLSRQDTRQKGGTGAYEDGRNLGDAQERGKES